MDRRPNMYSAENSTIGGFSSGAGNSSGNNHIPQQPAKSRGRPKGSKNKPRAEQPLVGRSLKPMMVTVGIQAGSDVVQWLFQFCCRRNVLLTVSSVSGFLSDVILYGRRSTITGPFLIESLFGTVRPVPPQSSESCCQLKVMLLEVQHSRLYGQLLRGKVTGGLVTVEVMMTELSKHSVQSVVTSDDRAKNINRGTSTSSNNFPNIQFRESYESATSHHVNNRLQIDHQKRSLMMNSTCDDSMTVVTGARSVGTERMMAAAGITTEKVTTDKTTLLSSEENNNTDTKESLSNTLGSHNDKGKSPLMESDVKSNNDDEFMGERDKLFDDNCWISLGFEEDEKEMMELNNFGLFDDDFWNS